jgi:glycine cleavage system H protein
MITNPSAQQKHYYTTDHEWIEFQDTVAYIGICKFKLTGFKQIQEITFNEPSGFKKQGDVIASIKYNDYLIEAHMPVDGQVLQVNEKLLLENPCILLEDAESSGWIALIVPSAPHQTKDLLRPDQYQLAGQSKYSK